MGTQIGTPREWVFDQAGMVKIMQLYFDDILMEDGKWEILSFYFNKEKSKFVVTYRVVDGIPKMPDIKIDRPGPITITIQIDEWKGS